jgi:nitroreductase
VDVLDAIATRRSIRKFRDEPIPDEALEAILTAGTQAPSARPRQPWRFVAVGREQRADMMRVMREGMAKAKLQGEDIGTCQWTARAMGQAAATVFVFNAHRMHPWLARSIEQ